MDIAVGILTDGAPQISRDDGYTIISNLLIGEGFHWERRRTGRFKGEIEMLGAPQGNIWCVNRLDIEDYIASVIGSEMNPRAPMEFLKAHAVISRSWAVKRILYASEHKGAENADNVALCYEDGGHRGFDVCNDDHCQRYQGVPTTDVSRVEEAVRATSGEVLTDSRGEVADARFSKCCGGHTELFSTCWADVDYDYLPAKPDPWCDLGDMSDETRREFLSTVLKDYDAATADFYRWEQRLRPRRLSDSGGTLSDPVEIEIVERGASGRIKWLRVVDHDGEQRIVGKELAIRRLLAADCLKSSWFDIKREADGTFLLQGRGWGHGVGLCQIGAACMAREGYDYRQILEFYYPNSCCKSAKNFVNL